MTAREIVAALTARGQTLAVAESLTGGLLSDAIVQVPGASRVFMGGIVAYDEGRKVTLLGVRQETLDQYTAVSRPTALEMARGARERLKTDWALSTTGYAGPDGENVGLVYVSLAAPDGVKVKELHLTGDRNRIRRLAVLHALDMLRRKLCEK